jgi:hypothetical protein
VCYWTISIVENCNVLVIIMITLSSDLLQWYVKLLNILGDYKMLLQNLGLVSCWYG